MDELPSNSLPFWATSGGGGCWSADPGSSLALVSSSSSQTQNMPLSTAISKDAFLSGLKRSSGYAFGTVSAVASHQGAAGCKKAKRSSDGGNNYNEPQPHEERNTAPTLQIDGNTTILSEIRSFSPNTLLAKGQLVASPSTQSETKRKVHAQLVKMLMLHIACIRGDTPLTMRILAADQGAAGRPAITPMKKLVYNHASNRLSTVLVRSRLRYPLNLALRQGAEPCILKQLIEAAPAVLQLPDGGNRCREFPLHVLLKYKPEDCETYDFMVSQCKDILGLRDGFGNTPLHTIVLSATDNSKDPSLAIIQSLCVLLRQSLGVYNTDGYTPLQLAQRNLRLPEDIVTYLWEQEGKMYELLGL